MKHAHPSLCRRGSLFALIAVSACGGNHAATAPGSADAGGGGVAAVTDVGTPTGPAATATIGAEGGQLMSADSRVTLIIPPMAVSAPTAFGIQPITNQAPGGIGAAYRMTPDGQIFATPATLSFSYGDADTLGTSADLLDVAYQDPATHTWLGYPQVTLDATARTVQVQTPHLTDWTMLTGYNLGPKESYIKVGQTLRFTVADCLPGPPTKLPNGTSVVPISECIVATGGFVNWAVNGAPGGTNGTGLIVATDGAHATYTAPATAPSPNTVNVSVQTPGRGATIVTALVHIGGAIHVDGVLNAGDFQICPLGTANVHDHFDFDLDIANKNIANLNNDDTTLTSPAESMLAPTITVDKTPEIFTVDALMDIQPGPGSASTVALKGTHQSGGCTVYYPGGGSTAAPAGAQQAMFMRFVVDDSKFDSSGIQYVPTDVPTWGLTLTK
jgi:hypothetical protein